MALAKALIQDQDGRQWLVMKDDPAWDSVALLRKARKSIVLPRDHIIRSVSVSPGRVQGHLERLSAGFALTKDPAIGEALKRAVVLYDCLAALRRVIMKVEGK